MKYYSSYKIIFTNNIMVYFVVRLGKFWNYP